MGMWQNRKLRRWERSVARTFRDMGLNELADQFLSCPYPRGSRQRVELQMGILESVISENPLDFEWACENVKRDWTT